MDEDRLVTIMQIIENFSTEHGYPPSVREIGIAVGVRSPSTVHQAINVLKRRGLAVSDDGVARSLRLTKEGKEWV